MQTENKVVAIILAAGLGTRMKSGKAKVLHEINGKPMVMYVIETAKKIVGDDIVLVVGKQADKVKELVSDVYKVIFAFQEIQLGTGHAVKCALPLIPEYAEQVLILCGDVPLLTYRTITKLYNNHISEKRDVSVLAVAIENPHGYGRIIMDDRQHVLGIVEEADATADQKQIKTINSGIYCVKKSFMQYSLNKIKDDNAQGEFYLTDIVKIGYKENKRVGAIIGEDREEILGVNSIQDLMVVEGIIKKRLGIIS
jgi:UDP-N-acetylglucosamine diphosphorylase/glucosamine-1-phosphate N-acetyltransferase